MIDFARVRLLLQSPKTRKYGLWTSIFLALVGAFGFLVLPPLVKSLLVKEIGQTLHRPVAIAGVAINPYALSVTLEGVSIGERGGGATFASFDRLYLNLEASSLFRGGPVLREVRLVNPKLRVVRQADKRYNFSDLIDAFSAKPAGNASPVSYSLSNIQVSGGEIEFDDRLLGEKHLVDDIKLNLPFLSNIAYASEVFVEPSSSARVNGAPLAVKGKSQPFASISESEVSLDVDGLPLAKFLDYAPFILPIKVDSGALDTRLKFVFRLENGKPSALCLSGTTVIRDLKVDDASRSPLVSLKKLELTIASADLMGRKFVLDRLFLDAPQVHARINRQGRLDWTGLANQLTATEKPSEDGVGKSSPAAASPSLPAIEWSLAHARLAGGVLSLSDESKKPVFKGGIDGLNLEASDITNRAGQAAKLDARFRLNGKGDFSLGGQVKLFPFETRLKLSAKSVDLLPLQPYFSEILNIAVTRGQLTLDGELQLRQSEQSGAEGISGGFAGDLTVGDFQAVDKINSADFLRWKSLHFGNIDARMGPDSLSIGEIALADFFARVTISPKGKLNLMQIVRNGETNPVEVVSSEKDERRERGASGDRGAPEGKASVSVESNRQSMLPIRIDRITLQGGNVRFTDHFVKPNYDANLRQIGGRISGLSSQAGTVATLDLRGRYDNVAPLTIKARVNPLSEKPYLDLHGEIKGVELTSFSTYSGKFAGYAIEKGKLSLNVNYKIENDQLQAENKVSLDQLTFGERVDSPEATSLPVTLAVALLKNRDGEIDIDLPISGSLDDPQFSVGGLVVKVVVNLIVKAVTSPFALLGSVFGGGEDLSNVEFDDGRSTITPATEKRLENLAKALIDRPALKLEITGRADPENDSEGLKRVRIERKVRAIKREELTRKNIASGSAETIEVTPQEYPALLERVYHAEKFHKPRNMFGFVKSLPVAEMEKLIIVNSVVDDDDLRELADRRAKKVQDWLVDHQVPAERIFLLPGKVGGAETPSAPEIKAKGGRADFTLK